MEKQKSDLDFKLMALAYKFRDLFLSRKNIVKEVGIKVGFEVLDYGCGPGSYVVPAAELVGGSGKVYALDIHPLAIQMVQDIASKKRLTNVVTIRSDCVTGLQNNSLDAILLYDVFHDLSNQSAVLEELHRVLKSNGILSVSDHHMEENEIVNSISNGGFFKVSAKGKKTYSFVKKRLDRT